MVFYEVINIAVIHIMYYFCMRVKNILILFWERE